LVGQKDEGNFSKLGEEAISSDEMILLVLKAQTNHFEHLDTDLRTEMAALNKELREELILLRKDMDKRFEQVDKRFEVLTSRIDHFMIWSFATTLTVGGLVIAAIKFLP
jgi:hypothetical protein